MLSSDRSYVFDTYLFLVATSLPFMNNTFFFNYGILVAFQRLSSKVQSTDMHHFIIVTTITGSQSKNNNTKNVI